MDFSQEYSSETKITSIEMDSRISKNSDDEYGPIDPTYFASNNNSSKIPKKSLSIYGGFNPELHKKSFELADVPDSEEEYGDVDPDYSKQTPTTSPTHQPRFVSKFESNNQVQKILSKDTNSDYEGEVDNKYLQRKTLSVYGKLEDQADETFEHDSDYEGEINNFLDPSIKKNTIIKPVTEFEHDSDYEGEIDSHYLDPSIKKKTNIIPVADFEHDSDYEGEIDSHYLDSSVKKQPHKPIVKPVAEFEHDSDYEGEIDSHYLDPSVKKQPHKPIVKPVAEFEHDSDYEGEIDSHYLDPSVKKQPNKQMTKTLSKYGPYNAELKKSLSEEKESDDDFYGEVDPSYIEESPVHNVQGDDYGASFSTPDKFEHKETTVHPAGGHVLFSPIRHEQMQHPSNPGGVNPLLIRKSNSQFSMMEHPEYRKLIQQGYTQEQAEQIFYGMMRPTEYSSPVPASESVPTNSRTTFRSPSHPQAGINPQDQLRSPMEYRTLSFTRPNTTSLGYSPYDPQEVINLMIQGYTRDQAYAIYQSSAAYPPPNSYPASGYNQQSIPLQQQQQPYSTPQSTPRPEIPNEESTLRIAMIISQQEAEFGVNMYDAMTPADQDEIDRYVSLGYSKDDAILMVFESKGFVSKQSIPTIEEVANNHTTSSQELHNDHKTLQERRTSFQKIRSIFAKNDKKHHELGKTPEEKELQKILKYKDADVKVIMGMGFTKEQAVQALIENRNDINAATNSLLASDRHNRF